MIPKRRLIFHLIQMDVTDSPFEEQFKILGCTLNRQGKTHECLEERMLRANKAWWKDVKIYRRKDVPWRVKCRGMAEHVYSVFCLEVKIGRGSHATLDRIRRWET